MSRRKGNATMTPAQYRRIVGKLRAAYVALKAGIFSNQEHGRALHPMIGKAHKWCGGSDGAR